MSVTSMIDIETLSIPQGASSIGTKIRLGTLHNHKTRLAPYYELRILRTQVTMHSLLPADTPGLMTMVVLPTEREVGPDFARIIGNGGIMASAASRQYRSNVVGAEPLWRVVTDETSLGYVALGVTGVRKPGETAKFAMGLAEITQTIQVRGFK